MSTDDRLTMALLAREDADKWEDQAMTDQEIRVLAERLGQDARVVGQGAVESGNEVEAAVADDCAVRPLSPSARG